MVAAVLLTMIFFGSLLLCAREDLKSRSVAQKVQQLSVLSEKLKEIQWSGFTEGFINTTGSIGGGIYAFVYPVSPKGWAVDDIEKELRVFLYDTTETFSRDKAFLFDGTVKEAVEQGKVSEGVVENILNAAIEGWLAFVGEG